MGILKKKFYRLSVTMQLILIVGCIVFPVNIISLTYAFSAQKVFIQQSEESARYIAQLYLNELDERAYSTDAFLISESNKNPHFLKKLGFRWFG